MITAIQVNYSEYGIMGEYETRNDRREYGITEKWVDAAIEKVITEGKRHEMAAAHFNHDDGGNDAIWQEYSDYGTRYITWRHDVDEYNSEKPVRISVAKFKRMIKKSLAV